MADLEISVFVPILQDWFPSWMEKNDDDTNDMVCTQWRRCDDQPKKVRKTSEKVTALYRIQLEGYCWREGMEEAHTLCMSTHTFILCRWETEGNWITWKSFWDYLTSHYSLPVLYIFCIKQCMVDGERGMLLNFYRYGKSRNIESVSEHQYHHVMTRCWKKCCFHVPVCFLILRGHIWCIYRKKTKDES